MSDDMDPGIAKLLQKSRARRQELRDFSCDKSPLPSEKNRERSPLKRLNKSPTRKVDIVVEDSPSNTVKRMLSRESLENNVKDLLSRDSPSKNIVSKTVLSPGKTTYTKTVITEKEEKFERKEVISYSGNKKELDDLKKKFDTSEDTHTLVYNSAIPREVSPSKICKESPSKHVSSTEKTSPTKTSKPFISVKTCIENDEIKSSPKDWESGKKARLAALSSKFRNFDEDEEKLFTKQEVQLPKPVTKPPPRAPSPSKHAPVNTDHLRSRSPVKASPHHNPNQFISPQVTGLSPTKPVDNARTSPVRNRSVRFVSPTKAPAPQPPVRERSISPCAEIKATTAESSLMESLKAQGFQETNSQSKLVYKFDKKESDTVDAVIPRMSPVRGNTFVKNDDAVMKRDRSVSPVRANIFLMKDKQNPEKRERGRSPIKRTAVTQPRSYSPEKPHPLQFVNPGITHGPPKPSRTYETVNTPAVNTIQQEEGTRVDSPVMMSVSKKREMFESGAHLTPEADRPDPALIPLSQRKALFEKNKSVPTPIARFGESVTPAMLAKAKPSDISSVTPSEAWKRKRPVSPSKGVILSAAKHENSKNTNTTVDTPKVTQPLAPELSRMEDLSSTPHTGRKTTEMQKKLFEAKHADWRDNSIAKKAADEKQSEMNLLLNRYNHLRKQSDDKEPETKKEDIYYPGVNSMKRVKVSPPRPGQLYPSINLDSDSDRPESVMSTDSQESCMTSATGVSEAPSLGADIVSAARVGAGPVPDLATIEENNDSMDTDDGDVLTDSVIGAEIDDIIGEAIDEEDDFPTPPKISKVSSSSSGSDQMGRSESTTSWEFHTPQAPKNKHPGGHSRYQTPLIPSNSPSTPDQQKVTIEGEEGPLMHTVSFYRRNKNPQSTPVQRIVLNPSLEPHCEVVESPRATITQKIHKLQEEANNQLPVIQQASSAVNLCRSTSEFFGSIEQVEGEKLLLVATHKRAAAVNEVQRLKTEGGLGADPSRDNSVRGTVSLCGIRLGLKKEFVEQVTSGEAGDFIHYFLCLVKCAGQCISTEMVNTSEGLEGCELNFPNLINFRDLDKSFSIQLEVYGLQTKKEQLNHDTKYHIKKGKMPFAALTPKLKMSKTESKLARPNVSSPGGPHTVRTSSFAMVSEHYIFFNYL